MTLTPFRGSKDRSEVGEFFLQACHSREGGNPEISFGQKGF
jgi:hypothetical protein